MTFPPDFISLMRDHLGAEASESLLRGLQEEAIVSVRFNPLKISGKPQGVGDPVPWCPHAYYLSQRLAFTFDPLFHAGVYYVQDASSMYLAEVLRRYLDTEEPLSALDLCAAPGGKSTLLASHLPQGSLLISNEPVRRRAQVLAENMHKWCAPARIGAGPSVPVRSVVTQCMPEEFSHLREAFDFILTDVPCSGEGMFRKDPVAVSEWSLRNVEQCAQRQRAILRSIVPTLRPGGLLVYSTCTFNRLEDEDQVRWLTDTFGFQLIHERHFFPGRDRGEGLYIAALRASGTYFNPSLITEKQIRTLRILTPISGEVKGEGHVSLDYAQAIAYLRREALHISAPRGIVVVTYRDVPLGLAKSVGNRLNNLYPQEWRIRTTYNPTEPVPDFFSLITT